MNCHKVFCKSCHLLHIARLRKSWSKVIDDLFAENQRLSMIKEESEASCNSRKTCQRKSGWPYAQLTDLMAGSIKESTRQDPGNCSHPGPTTLRETGSIISRTEKVALGGSRSTGARPATVRRTFSLDSVYRLVGRRTGAKCRLSCQM